jgi:hypothetical protein
MTNKKSSKKCESNETESHPYILEKYINPKKFYTPDELIEIAKELIRIAIKLSHKNEHKLAGKHAMTALTLFHMLSSDKYQFNPNELVLIKLATDIADKPLKEILKNKS